MFLYNRQEMYLRGSDLGFVVQSLLPCCHLYLLW